MPRTLEEIKAVLVEKKSDDVYGDIVSLVEAEKTRGIEEKRKVNGEAQNLRKYKIAMEKVAKDMGVDFDDADSFLSDLVEKSRGHDKGREAALKDKDVLAKKLEAIEKRLNDSENEKTELKNKAKIATIKNRLLSDLKDHIHAPEDVINSRIIGRGIVDLLDDNETIQFVNGEERVDYKKGIEQFLANNADVKKNKQQSGTGVMPGNADSGKKKMAFDEWNRLSGRDKAAFFAGGGTLEN
jgi:hypothetical protein